MVNQFAIRIFRLMVCLFFLAACETPGDRTAQTASLPNIHKSPNDDRHYRALRLPNGLQVVLVSDPSLEVAAVAMGVGVGSYQDPDEHVGLAHYLEHMLFLGTEKYPEPNSFQKFVDENAGSWNAYTATDHTNYHYQLNAEKLDESLDYFSDYFKKPTFDPQFSDKERNAVHSEWSMSRSQDSWIMYRISGITANPAHPARRLTAGNLETLADRPGSPLHQALLDFYARYYSANNMRLTLVAKQSLDELENFARKHFASIPNKNIPYPDLKIPGITAKEKGKVIHYQSLRDMKQTVIEFPIKDNSHQWRVKPNTYVINLITSEEPGTVGEQLRRVGLINMLYGYVEPDAYGKDGYLRIVAELTDTGLQQRDQVIAAIFAYVDLIKKDGVDEVYFREFQAMLQKEFENLAKPKPLQQAMQLSRDQFDYPVQHLLDHDYLYQSFDKRAIRAVLQQLRPEQARIWHISNKEPTDTPVPYYEGSYSIRSITSAELAKWRKLTQTINFSLPPENPLFSQQQSSLVDFVYHKPRLVMSEAGAEAWLMHPQHYREDKGYLELQVNVDFAFESIQNAIYATLLQDLFALQQMTLIDRAGRAGIVIKTELTPDRSQVISISGYANHQLNLMKELTENLAALNFNEQDFAQILDRFIQTRMNAKKAPPYQQLFDHRSRLVRQASWTDDEFIAAAREVNAAGLRDYHQRILRDNLLRLYAFGNFDEAQIQDAAHHARTALSSQRQPEQRHLLPFITPKAHSRLDFAADIEQTDSAVLMGFIGTEQSLRQQAALLLLNGLLSNELFTQLRTNEQLGYVVGSAPAAFADYPMYVMFVQSTNTDVASVKRRLDKFRQDFYEQLRTLNPDSLEQLRKSEIAQLTQRPANFLAEAQEHVQDFRWARLDFSRKEQVVAALKEVTHEEILALYRRLILEGRGAPMLIQLRGTHFADKPFATVN